MKPTETQQKVLDCIEKFSDCNAETISRVTGLNKLLVFKLVKGLAEGGLIKISDSKPPTYKITKVDFKNKNASKIESKNAPSDEVALKSATRDTGKLKFNGEMYGKGRLVLAVIKEYVKKNPRTTITKLKEVFPEELQPRYGVIQEVSKARKMSVDRERFFLKAEDLIKIGDKKIAVCNQFGANNLPLKHFRSLGFSIK